MHWAWCINRTFSPYIFIILTHFSAGWGMRLRLFKSFGSQRLHLAGVRKASGVGGGSRSYLFLTSPHFFSSKRCNYLLCRLVLNSYINCLQSCTRARQHYCVSHVLKARATEPWQQDKLHITPPPWPIQRLICWGGGWCAPFSIDSTNKKWPK